MKFLKFERERFEKLVGEAIDGLPEEFQKKIENVDIVVETRPSREILKQQGIKPPGTLLGLYQGIPLKNRGVGYANVLPDRITIYQEPVEALCTDENEIKGKVREVFMHELGHHFGMSEEDLAP
jgi:predicted Zn-dependent protease with MMP-like domain